MKYRTKPFEVEAIQWTGSNIEEIKEFVGDSLEYTVKKYKHEHGKESYELINEIVVKINTLEGVMTASVGDYIVKGMLGEFYPCNPKVFETKYEPIYTSGPSISTNEYSKVNYRVNFKDIGI